MPVVGVVPYLNAVPLVETLPATVEQRLAEPSRLAGMLREGSLDAALLPVAESFSTDLATYLGSHGIACDGDVESVLAFSQLPGPPFPARVVLDPASRTSVRLLRVLLERQFRERPQYETAAVAGPDPTRDPEALTLVIGDRAFARRRAWRGAVLDLGGAWREWTGLPFVFARWTARPGLPDAERRALARVLDDAAEAGILSTDALAERHGPAHGLSVDDARRYLSTAVRYRIGGREESGLVRFRAESSGLAGGA